MKHPSLSIWFSLRRLFAAVLIVFVWTLLRLPAAETPSSPIGTPATNTTDPLEWLRAETELRKADLEYVKTDDTRPQFYWKLGFDVLLVVAGAGLLVWMFPQIQEFSLPWGGVSLTAKRAPKEAIPPATLPAATPQAMSETAEILKKAVSPEAGQEALLGKLDEASAYLAAGVPKDSIYLVHQAKAVPRSDYHRLRISLDADRPELLERVEKVTYVLHPTFGERELPVTDRAKGFALELTVWGEFMLFARVHLRGAAQPVTLKRYLNF